MKPDDIAFEKFVKAHNVPDDIEFVKKIWLAATLAERRGCVRLCFATWDAMAQGCGKLIKRRVSDHNRNTYE